MSPENDSQKIEPSSNRSLFRWLVLEKLINEGPYTMVFHHGGGVTEEIPVTLDKMEPTEAELKHFGVIRDEEGNFYKIMPEHSKTSDSED